MLKEKKNYKCSVSIARPSLGETEKLLKQSLTTFCSHNISCFPNSIVPLILVKKQDVSEEISCSPDYSTR